DPLPSSLPCSVLEALASAQWRGTPAPLRFRNLTWPVIDAADRCVIILSRYFFLSLSFSLSFFLSLSLPSLLSLELDFYLFSVFESLSLFAVFFRGCHK